MNNILAKLGLAGTTSIVVTEAVSLDVLWNALITLAISVLSVLAVEGVALLKKYLQKKYSEIKLKDESKSDDSDDKQ